MKTTTEAKPELKAEHLAKASGKNLPVSTKHSLELCRNIRYKTTAEAKKILEDVIAMKRPIKFYRFFHDIGHRAGIGSGRFPKKAAAEMLRLVKSVEANAQAKGLNSANLKIIHILANRAPEPMTGNRFHRGTKRTHLEIAVKELSSKVVTKKEAKSNEKNNDKVPQKTVDKTINKSKSPISESKGESK